MALAIDGSTPAVATQTVNTTNTVTTASFTPPANCIIYIRWAWNTLSGENPTQPTITDSLGGHLTYTRIDWQSHVDSPTVSGQAAHWWAKVTTSAAMTVTVTGGSGIGGHGGALHVTVITGSDLVSPIGAHGKSGSVSAASIAQSYTAQASSGWGFLGVCDWDQKGAETAGTGCTLTNGGSANVGLEITYGFIRRSSADDSNGSSNTLNVTLPGTSTNLAWVYAEVLPAGGGSTVNGTATIAGAGALTASVTESITASLAGAGSLTAPVVQRSSSTATGAGALASPATTGPTATAAGAGTLSALATQRATATLAGAGVLAGAVVQSVTATITGAGSLTASGSSSGGTTATLTGAGALSASVTQGSSATPTGAGSLSATVVQNGKTTLTGAGTLTAAGFIAGSAALTGVGSVAAPVRLLVGAGLIGAGVLTVSAGGVASGTASLVGAGALAINLNPCVTPRPNSGTTTYATATTARPTGGTTAYNTAITARPDSGQTTDPC